jgi:hypothetical protein
MPLPKSERHQEQIRSNREKTMNNKKRRDTRSHKPFAAMRSGEFAQLFFRKQRKKVGHGMYWQRLAIPPRIPSGGTPRNIPAGRFLWHNHVQHYVGMPHGLNGFRYWNADLPVDYRKFERCHCGVVELPHYKIRGLGSGKCVSPPRVSLSFEEFCRLRPDPQL